MTQVTIHGGEREKERSEERERKRVLIIIIIPKKKMVNWVALTGHVYCSVSFFCYPILTSTSNG